MRHQPRLFKPRDSRTVITIGTRVNTCRPGPQCRLGKVPEKMAMKGWIALDLLHRKLAEERKGQSKNPERKHRKVH